LAFGDIKEQLYQKMLRRQEAGQGKAGESSALGLSLNDVRISNGTFDQVLDHFSSRRSTFFEKIGRKKSPYAGVTFKQRYFVDSTYARDSYSPVIYYICGESTCEGATGTPLVNQLAAKYHAHRVALEHRYYGYSQPFTTLSSQNLQFLSMAQAIEDLASFQRYAQSVLGMKGKWISVGGSYPGELSAFYRMRHPELVAGALASSAPVFAKADFIEYDRHVARVADPACLRVIQKVVADVEGRLKSSSSRDQVKKLFDAERVVHDVDFLYNLADMAAIAIQYGFQNEFCTALKDGDQRGQALEEYARVGLSLFQRLGTSSFQDAFDGAMSIDPKDYLESAGRQWMYQSCSEFGFYQTANPNPAESARSARIDLAYHNDACNRLFGIKAQVDADRTNRTYYQRLFDSGVKNIYFTNGSNDPWSNLSLTDASATQGVNPGLQLFVIQGAAHCDDLGRRVSSALGMARNQFDQLFSKWISE
jgi:pimeloyl-ACP methyl ester carboxylesterase